MSLDPQLITAIVALLTLALFAFIRLGRHLYKSGHRAGYEECRVAHIEIVLAAKAEGARRARLELGHGVIGGARQFAGTFDGESLRAGEIHGDWRIDPTTLSAVTPPASAPDLSHDNQSEN